MVSFVCFRERKVKTIRVKKRIVTDDGDRRSPIWFLWVIGELLRYDPNPPRGTRSNFTPYKIPVFVTKDRNDRVLKTNDAGSRYHWV